MLGGRGWLGGTAVVLLLSGCGASEPITVEQGALGQALVSIAELPPGAGVTEDPPEPCGPLPVLEERATDTAVSKMFVLGETRLKEAVGYFPAEQQAADAYGELIAKKRSECIRESLETFGGVRVEIEALEPLGLSDSETLTRYVGTEPGNGEMAVDVAAVKFGLCVAAVIVLQEDGSAAAARKLLDRSVQPAAIICQ